MHLPKYSKDGKFFPNSNFKTDTYFKSVNLDHAKKHGGNIYLNAVRRENNSKLARLKKGHCFIYNIFLNYWSSFKDKFSHLLSRPAVTLNIERFLACGDISKGFLLFKCKNGCGTHYQGFSCHSKFCPRCAKVYRDRRCAKVSEKLFNVPHRQFTFSIPKEYRLFFRKYRSLLNTLFLTINQLFDFVLGNDKGIAKMEKRKAGIISFLHTFGRDMKWNPHLHCLVAERYMNSKGELKKFDYFHFDRIRKFYKFRLMKNVYLHLKSIHASKEDLKELYYLNKYLSEYYDDGFYIHGPKLKNHSLKSMKALTNYVARYASHPPISERRITNVDYELDLVSWFFDPHEENFEDDKKKGRQFVTEHVFDFMKRLIIHINDKNFQVIRYSGFYANKARKPDILQPSLFTEKQIKEMTVNTTWIRGLYNTYGFNPLICDVCGQRMHLDLDQSYFPKGG